jgi:hypothetical protein
MLSESEVTSQVLSFFHRLYGLKRHWASRHHFDLRLEWNGNLLSWAISDSAQPSSSCSLGGS